MTTCAKPKRPCIEVKINKDGGFIVSWVSRNGRTIATSQASGLKSKRTVLEAIKSLKTICNSPVYFEDNRE